MRLRNDPRIVAGEYSESAVTEGRPELKSHFRERSAGRTSYSQYDVIITWALKQISAGEKLSVHHDPFDDMAASRVRDRSTFIELQCVQIYLMLYRFIPLRISSSCLAGT